MRYALKSAGVRQEIRFHHDTFEFNDALRPAPNLSYARRLTDYSSGGKFVYMSRDPRDILVSLYHQVTGRFKDFFDYQGSISDFVRDDYFGASNLKIFRDHWNALCRSGLAYCISYEQCHENFYAVLRSILDYYEIEVNGEKLLEAVSASSFKAMREREIAGDFPEPWLRPRNGFLKTRIGRVRDYHVYLSQEDIRYLDAIFDL